MSGESATTGIIMTAEAARQEYVPQNVSPKCRAWLDCIEEKMAKERSTAPHGTFFGFPSFSDAGWDAEPSSECMQEIKHHLRRAGNTVSQAYCRDHGSPSESFSALHIAWNPTWRDSWYGWKDRTFGSTRYGWSAWG